MPKWIWMTLWIFWGIGTLLIGTIFIEVINAALRGRRFFGGMDEYGPLFIMWLVVSVPWLSWNIWGRKKENPSKLAL